MDNFAGQQGLGSVNWFLMHKTVYDKNLKKQTCTDWNLISYQAHVFAVQLGEPCVVGNGRHDHCQVPERQETHTCIRPQNWMFKLPSSSWRRVSSGTNSHYPEPNFSFTLIGRKQFIIVAERAPQAELLSGRWLIVQPFRGGAQKEKKTENEGREKETDVAIDGWVSGLFNKAALWFQLQTSNSAISIAVDRCSPQICVWMGQTGGGRLPESSKVQQKPY